MGSHVYKPLILVIIVVGVIFCFGSDLHALWILYFSLNLVISGAYVFSGRRAFARLRKKFDKNSMILGSFPRFSILYTGSC